MSASNENLRFYFVQIESRLATLLFQSIVSKTISGLGRQQQGCLEYSGKLE